jgi:hypothetical protein
MVNETKQASVFFFCLYLPLTLVTERQLEYRNKVDVCEWGSEPLCYIRKGNKQK